MTTRVGLTLHRFGTGPDVCSPSAPAQTQLGHSLRRDPVLVAVLPRTSDTLGRSGIASRHPRRRPNETSGPCSTCRCSGSVRVDIHRGVTRRDSFVTPSYMSLTVPRATRRPETVSHPFVIIGSVATRHPATNRRREHGYDHRLPVNGVQTDRGPSHRDSCSSRNRPVLKVRDRARCTRSVPRAPTSHIIRAGCKVDPQVVY